MSTRKNNFGSANVGRLFGAVGLVLWASAPLTWLLTADFGGLVVGKVVLGTVGIGVYLATNADFFARVAGARSSGLLAMSVASSAAVLAVVVAINIFSVRHPREVDLTQEGLYTLTDTTKDLLKRLKQEVKVLAFYPSLDPRFAAVQEVLGRYQKGGEHLTFEMVDPQARPDLVEKYQITDRGPRLVVTCGHQDARAKEPSEQELTYAIIKVAEQTRKTVTFLAGHGEGDIKDGEQAEGFKALADAIAAEGYEVDSLDFTRPSGPGAATGAAVNLTAPAAAPHALEVPAQVAVLVVLAAKRPLNPPEVAALEAYAARGGRLLVALEPKRVSGLESLLAQYKIEVRDDFIVDVNPLNQLMGLGAAAPLVQPAQVDHPIVRGLQAPAVMLTARSLAVGAGGLSGVDTEVLAQTGESAWGETHLGADGTASRDDKDHPPPLGVALAASRGQPQEAAITRIVAFGDSDWLNNRYLSMQGNQDLALNALNWAAAVEEKISIRPKARAGSQLFLSGQQLGQLKFFSMDILPVMLIATGLGIVLIRRQR